MCRSFGCASLERLERGAPRGVAISEGNGGVLLDCAAGGPLVVDADTCARKAGAVVGDEAVSTEAVRASAVLVDLSVAVVVRAIASAVCAAGFWSKIGGKGADQRTIDAVEHTTAGTRVIGALTTSIFGPLIDLAVAIVVEAVAQLWGRFSGTRVADEHTVHAAVRTTALAAKLSHHAGHADAFVAGRGAGALIGNPLVLGGSGVGSHIWHGDVWDANVWEWPCVGDAGIQGRKAIGTTVGDIGTMIVAWRIAADKPEVDGLISIDGIGATIVHGVASGLRTPQHEQPE